MNKPSNPERKSKKSSSSKELKSLTNSLESKVSKLQEDINSLSYEEAVKQIELLLAEIQNENILIEEIQQQYLKGQIYIQHCEQLLNEAEQSISNIDIKNI